MDYSQASSSFNVIPRQEYAVGCHFLSRGIFLMQGLNPGLLHCEQIIYPRASPQALYMYLYKYICVCVYIMYIGNTLSPPFWRVLHLQIHPTARRILCLWAAVHWIPRCRNLEKPRTEWGIWATSVFWYRGVCSGTSSLEILREDCIRHLCLQIATFYPCLFPCWIITVENPWWEFTNNLWNATTKCLNKTVSWTINCGSFLFNLSPIISNQSFPPLLSCVCLSRCRFLCYSTEISWPFTSFPSFKCNLITIYKSKLNYVGE